MPWQALQKMTDDAEYDLNDLATLIHVGNEVRGFWTDKDKIKGFWEHGLRYEADADYRRTAISSRLALIHSEVSEALEVVRAEDEAHPLTETWYEQRFDGAKPEGFPSELADIIIRVLDLAGALNIDIHQAMTEKLQYNATRPYKHGKKL